MWVYAALLIAVVAAGLWVFRQYGVPRMVFPTWALHRPPEPALPDHAERWIIPAGDGEVEAFLFLSQSAKAGRAAPAVIFAHGNAELIDDLEQVARFYNRAGLSVLLPEYRGYGRSAGTPSERAIVSDYVRFYDKLAALTVVNREQLVFHGRSLGAGVIVGLSRQRPAAAIILTSAFTSIGAVARQSGVPSFLVRDLFDNLAALKQSPIPLLIAHGKRDEIIPYRHATVLHAAVPGSRLVALPCGHNDCQLPESEILDHLRRAGVLNGAGG